MSRKILYYIAVFTIALAFIAQPSGSASAAATCTRSACNGIDPYGTTCWNDRYIAAGGTIYTGGSGKMRNYNYYSPTCVANWSWTENMNSPKVYRWLGAETQYGYLYNGNIKYQWVWNSMVDGYYTVCTKGYQGNTTYATYDVSSPWVCA